MKKQMIYPISSERFPDRNEEWCIGYDAFRL